MRKSIHCENSFFDTIADEYDSSLPSHIVDYYLEKRVRFIKRLTKEGSVLDLGCGTGNLAGRLINEGFSTTGLDSSIGMLRKLRDKNIRVKLLQGTSDALPFKSETFDLTICVALMHHIVNRTTISRTISEMIRVTKRGGRVVIWDHNPLNPYWPVLMKKVPQDAGQVRLVPLREILRSVNSEPVQKIYVHRSGWVPEFAPCWALPFFSIAESFLERLPLIRCLGAHNVVVTIK